MSRVVYAVIDLLSQSTFCVNSLAHWLGESPFDDKHTPKDHMITAFVTVGEGYHNFHHQVSESCSGYQQQLNAPVVPNGLSKCDQMVPVRPHEVVHLGYAQDRVGEPLESLP